MIEWPGPQGRQIRDRTPQGGGGAPQSRGNVQSAFPLRFDVVFEAD